MKSLYSKVVLITLTVMLISSVSGFLFSNLYYQLKLKPYNDEKLTRIAQDVTKFYQEDKDQDIDHYLNYVGRLGYQVYVTNGKNEHRYYGGDFRVRDLSETDIKSVLNGKTYHGIRNFSVNLFITGFFDNNLKNTIGVPLSTPTGTKALFIRSNPEEQFGELRIFFALILVLTAIISIILVFISTRMIVNPITKLTKATKKIATGNFDVNLNSKTNDEIGQLAKSFTVMTDELKKSELARQEFVANVSHELKSPLTSMQGFAELILQGNVSTNKQQEYMRIIASETSRLGALTKQLLLLASLDRNETFRLTTRVNIKESIRQIVQVLLWSIQSKNQTIVLEMENAYLQAEPDLIQQVWQNLIANAVKYTSPGGEIKIRVTTRGNEIVCLFQDNGAGIAKENQSKIYDRFYQVDRARARDDESSGLGLAITKKIIELHGGRIHLDSELNKGSRFTIFFPKA